jgi:hypothetical protein
MAKPSWQQAVDDRAAAGFTIGQAWYDQQGPQFKKNNTAEAVARYAASRGYGLGDAWKIYGQQTTAAPKEAKNVTQALRIAGEGGITKQELNQITKQFDTPANKVVQRLDQINQNLKAKDQTGINLNSGAANMLIKQAENQTGYDAYLNALTGQSAFGSGQIGKTLQSMIGSPGMFGEPATPGFNPGGSATANRMIGGTTIRPGGRIAVRPVGVAPAVAPTAETMAPATAPTATAAETPGDAFDFQSILDALTGAEQPQMDMSALTDMFNTQFDELTSQFETMKPLQLAQLGRAYGGDAIRAAQRMRKARRDYRRGLPAQALGQAFTNLAIGGGMTL